jgi:hypothetical protein
MKIVVKAKMDLPKVDRSALVWQPITDKWGTSMRLGPLEWQPSGAHYCIQHLLDEIKRLKVKEESTNE